MQKPLIAYLRVSTTKQGVAGLGIEAQREAVTAFAATRSGEILAEYVEVESGKRNDRPALVGAIAHARRTGSILVIAKLDRLARSVAFISSLMEAKTEFIAVDAPYANRLMLHLLAAFAEHEREQISVRTKAALAAAKARGVVLGRNGRVLADQHSASARGHATTMGPLIQQARSQGLMTCRSIAAYLNAKGVPSREGANWHPASVARVLRRLGEGDLQSSCAV